MDFDKPKVYGDTSITDGLVFFSKKHKENREVDIDNTSYSLIASWQGQSLGN